MEESSDKINWYIKNDTHITRDKLNFKDDEVIFDECNLWEECIKTSDGKYYEFNDSYWFYDYLEGFYFKEITEAEALGSIEYLFNIISSCVISLI